MKDEDALKTMSRKVLTPEEVNRQLASFPDWSLHDGKLHRICKFRDFSEAFAFVTRVALEAERLNHHPEGRNVWNTVEIDLVTHDSGGISALDFSLAESIDSLLG